MSADPLGDFIAKLPSTSSLERRKQTIRVEKQRAAERELRENEALRAKVIVQRTINAEAELARKEQQQEALMARLEQNSRINDSTRERAAEFVRVSAVKEPAFIAEPFRPEPEPEPIAAAPISDGIAVDGEVFDRVAEPIVQPIFEPVVLKSSTALTPPKANRVRVTFTEVPKKMKSSLSTSVDALSLAREAEALFRLPAGTMELMLHLESGKPVQGGKHDPTKRGGFRDRYLGLYQFFDRELDKLGNPYAWGVARATAAKYGQVVGNISNWADAKTNTLAAAAYAAFHRDELAKKGVQANPAMLYHAHQQGIAAVQKSVATGKPVIVGAQSPESVRVIKSAYGKS